MKTPAMSADATAHSKQFTEEFEVLLSFCHAESLRRYVLCPHLRCSLRISLRRLRQLLPFRLCTDQSLLSDPPMPEESAHDPGNRAFSASCRSSPSTARHRNIATPVWCRPLLAPVNRNKRYPVLYMQDGQDLFDEATAIHHEWKFDETVQFIPAA
jgi:hypothetical protein